MRGNIGVTLLVTLRYLYVTPTLPNNTPTLPQRYLNGTPTLHPYMFGSAATASGGNSGGKRPRVC